MGIGGNRRESGSDIFTFYFYQEVKTQDLTPVLLPARLIRMVTPTGIEPVTFSFGG